MSVINDPRVIRHGDDYQVNISHGEYLVEHDNRVGLWWAYDRDGLGLAGKGRTNPLTRAADACVGYGTPDELIGVLLAYDSAEVPA